MERLADVGNRVVLPGKHVHACLQLLSQGQRDETLPRKRVPKENPGRENQVALKDCFSIALNSVYNDYVYNDIPVIAIFRL